MKSPSSRLSRIRADPIIARGAPFLLFIGLVVLGSGLQMPWIVVGRAVVVAALLAWFWRGYTELRGPAKVRPADWASGLACGIVVFLAWIALDQDWAVLSRAAGYMPLRADGSVDWFQALGRLAGFAVVVPVMEELFWRSLVLRWIERHDFQSLVPRDVGWRAFAITTALFAFEHDRWLAGAIAGAAYNWLYMRSGNLWVPIVAHVVTNGILGLWVLQTGRWEFW